MEIEDNIEKEISVDQVDNPEQSTGVDVVDLENSKEIESRKSDISLLLDEISELPDEISELLDDTQQSRNPDFQEVASAPSLDDDHPVITVNPNLVVSPNVNQNVQITFQQPSPIVQQQQQNSISQDSKPLQVEKVKRKLSESELLQESLNKFYTYCAVFEMLRCSLVVLLGVFTEIIGLFLCPAIWWTIGILWFVVTVILSFIWSVSCGMVLLLCCSGVCGILWVASTVTIIGIPCGLLFNFPFYVLGFLLWGGPVILLVLSPLLCVLSGVFCMPFSFVLAFALCLVPNPSVVLCLIDPILKESLLRKFGLGGEKVIAEET